jgi:hypothetical protein
MSESVDSYNDVLTTDEPGPSPDDSLPFETDVFVEGPGPE